MSNGNTHDTNRKKEQKKRVDHPNKSSVCLVRTKLSSSGKTIQNWKFNIWFHLIFSQYSAILYQKVTTMMLLHLARLLNLIIQTYYMYRIRKNKIRLQYVFSPHTPQNFHSGWNNEKLTHKLSFHQIPMKENAYQNHRTVEPLQLLLWPG